MSATLNRRAILTGKVQNIQLQRPPGAADEMNFHDSCTACGECVSACPENIIVRDSKELPFLDFNKGACTFCHACTDACTDVFRNNDSNTREQPALQHGRPWGWHAKIKPTCLSLNAVNCRACEDHCDERAIRFRLQVGGLATPILDSELCTGCGACLPTCPIDAISLNTPPPQSQLESQT